MQSADAGLCIAHLSQSRAAHLATLHCVVNDAGGLTMRHKAASVSTAKPEQGSLELTEELVRIRAYRLYEERGCEHGHDLEDWLQAEAEIFGKKPAAAAEAEDAEDGSRTTVA
jgi:hypothetical protein